MKLILLALMLSGCGAVNLVAEKGVVANDDAVTTAVFVLCQGASTGAIKRKFDTPERVEVLLKLCAI